jgi:ABC-type antimicrobial peptide transport system permease subunit
MWPGQQATGQQLVVDYSTAGTYPYEVVGVVGDIRFHGPRSQPQPEIFFPHAQRAYLVMNVVIKSTGDPRALIPAVRAVLREVDAQKPAHGISLLSELVGTTYVRDRQAMVMLLVFAGSAILLVVMSVYGVLSQRVRERSREIGIRMALGADASSVMRWIAAAGLRLIVLGAVLGAAAAWAGTRALDGLLFGVAPADPVTTVVVLAAVGVVGCVATLIPAWRASRIDPVATLRRG